jgi:redox-sensitive bicupin YhaK (pirin superfamily)
MRKIQKVFRTTPAVEGAGVHLKRGFSNREAEQFDPFLMFDDFSNTEAAAYAAGFPAHPHRGMETVTYILEGEVHHKDSMGSEGSIRAGDVQWMTAGSGIIHEEMPIVHEEGIRGFQLWVNLPSVHKMMAPRYQEIKSSEIPVVQEEGVEVRVIAGVYKETTGPVQDLMVSPTYLDVKLGERVPFTFPTNRDDTFFIYVFAGRLALRDDRTESWLGEGDIGLLTNDFQLTCNGGKDGARFLLIGGKPLKEPVAWHGPIVMNTEEELKTALEDLNRGTFIKES